MARITKQQIINRLIDGLNIPGWLEWNEQETLKQAIKDATSKPRRASDLRYHLCNEVMDGFKQRWLIGGSYEDQNIKSMEDAVEFFELLEDIVPGAFVLVETGDYITPECSEAGLGGDHYCDTYDAFYNYFLINIEVWNEHGSRLQEIDRVWRDARNKCQREVVEIR